ncbi:MAG: hypothetical protein H6696_03935 [Deferribacteres bacterium]|nr:hypothetical protein [candidate division KSB1 bacterium]MCB9501063.1 hypothetical protein [Deferribacteres bacterium]
MHRSLIILFIFITLSVNLLAGPQKFNTYRLYEPVVLTGAQLPDIIGSAIEEIAGFRYSKAQNTWTQIPVQVDERKYMDLSVPPGKRKHLAAEYVYVGYTGGVLGAQLARDTDPRFDDDDELVFMLEDGGDKAPTGSSPPAATGNRRLEIAISDPVQPGTQTFVYLFSVKGTKSMRGDLTYHLTNGREHGAVVETEYYRVNYSRRWVLDQIRIKNTLQGNGQDLIDQLKFRAYGLTPQSSRKMGMFNETEEYWSDGPGDCQFSKKQGCSWYLGHKVGPVRAIRMVQGAASGPTTSYFSYFYRKMFAVQVNYRVHPLPYLWFYLDYDSELANPRFYDAENSGIAIDGRQDALRSNGPKNWGQMSSAAGSIVTWMDIDEFRHLGSKTQVAPYYRDDSHFNDLTGSDGKAMGNHGVYITDIPDTDKLKAVVAHFKIFLLPANASSAGEQISRNMENPLTIRVQSE